MKDKLFGAVGGIDLDQLGIVIEYIEFVVVECQVSIDEIAFKAW